MTFDGNYNSEQSKSINKCPYIADVWIYGLFLYVRGISALNDVYIQINVFRVTFGVKCDNRQANRQKFFEKKGNKKV